MNGAYLLLIILLVSCAQSQLRRPSSTVDTNFYFDEIDVDKSIVKLFPPEIENGVFHYYFFIQLKNKLGRYTDIEEKDIQLMMGKKDKLEFRLERQLRGRYYVKMDTSKEFPQKKLDIFIFGKMLKEQFSLSMAPISKKHCKLKLLAKKNHRARFQLFLADKNKRGVEIPTSPEIIVDPDGSGEIEDLIHVKEGVWEFTMAYPEQNNVMYINIRAHGVTLERMYRFQHVENSH